MVAADQADNDHGHNNDSDKSKNDVIVDDKIATFITRNRSDTCLLPHDNVQGKCCSYTENIVLYHIFTSAC